MKESFIKQISTAILSAMIIGLGGYIWAMAIHIDRVDADVTNVTKSLDRIEKKVDKIHWYLLESKESD